VTSVVVSSYTRSRSLRETLASLANMAVPADLSWELIVVDNNSSTDTRAVTGEFSLTSGLNV
jgi:glycosyltransferase involved in cell wall biosynthesis